MRGRREAAVEAVAASLNEVPMSGLKGEVHEAWMKIHPDLQNAIAAMKKAEDLDRPAHVVRGLVGDFAAVDRVLWAG